MLPVPLILVVDDDPDVCALLRRALAGDGAYEVEVALDGHIALAFCAQRMPQLVLLDLMMPQMDGEHFAMTLRERFGKATPPIILLSASQIRAQVAESLGAAGAVEKPFDLDELRETIAQICPPAK